MMFKNKGSVSHKIRRWQLEFESLENHTKDSLPKCINTKFVCSLTTVYKLCKYAKLPNIASTINPMPGCFLIASKIHFDDVLK